MVISKKIGISDGIVNLLEHFPLIKKYFKNFGWVIRCRYSLLMSRNPYCFRLLMHVSLYLYYKSWNNWKRFSPRLGPPYPLRRPHLSGQKAWRKRGGDWFRQYFPPKFYYFLHQQFSIHTFCTHILLSFSIHILFFAHTLTHNSCCFFFWKDNNWHHCLWKKKKDVY